jgi:hypothetical protein
MSVLDAVPFLRRGKEDRESILEDVRSLRDAEVLPLSGEPIKARGIQSLSWSIPLGLLAAGTIAGIYDVLWEIHWYVHLGGFYWPGWSLKSWWDGGLGGWIRSPAWRDYRHAAFRDLLEPAAATMGVKTIFAKRKWWYERVGPVRLLTAPLAVLAIAIGLGLLGTYVLDFGGPAAWHFFAAKLGHPGYTVPGTKWMGRVSLGKLLLGFFVIGLAVHRYWAPVGATLQGTAMDRSVDRAQAKAEKAELSIDEVVRLDKAGYRMLPLWVSKPLSPPVLRERFADTWRNNKTVRAVKGRRWLIVTIIIVAAVLTFIGLVGHYWVGVLHHSFWYLFPPGS